MRRALAGVACMLALACEPARAPVVPGPSCDEVGTVSAAASVPDRHLLGHASPYPADAMLRARADELGRSQRARRAAAWDAVARVLTPVELTEPTPVEGARVPRFRTWYDSEDFARVFRFSYERLGTDGRAARARFDDAALDAALGWNVDHVITLPGWTTARWQAYVAALEDESAIAGVGGLRRIAMSPDAARHVMRSYPEILGCLERGAPPAFVDGPPSSAQQLAREPLSMERCSARSIGPFFVARGGTLRARIESDDATGAELRVSEGPTAARAEPRCAVTADAVCEHAGPGMFFVTVVAGAGGLEGVLEVEHVAPDVALAACLEGPFPLASATVAAEWRRVEPDRPLPVYDTSSTALARRLAPGAEATWGEGDGLADPDERAIYTMRLPSGAVFRLAGLHIRTRELDHWLNITLWWSDRPDEDFGADRPESVRALGAPWSSYKMCVAIEHQERDPDPGGGLGDIAPSLAAALAATHEGPGGASWCSNPYIDAAPGLVRSNCVGCHQHAMSGVRPASVALEEERFPDHGRALIRNNFPGDQCWGLDGGDDLAAVISETVDYWDAAE